jgi:hypothetical protein
MGEHMAGYSGTPLPQKLGIKAGHHVALLQAPAEFKLGDLPENVALATKLRGTTHFDVILYFSDKHAEVSKTFLALANRLTSAGGLWICWPKKSSGVETDLDENIIRDLGLAIGLVDNKVCAVDDTWSGLRFVWRLVHRPKS